MNKRRLPFCLLIILCLPFHGFTQTFYTTADSVRVTRGVPGLVYAAFSSDSILDEGVLGWRKFRTKDTLQLSDRFAIGTNTAAFTAFIAQRLIDLGKISLQTKLLDLYPEFKKIALPVYKQITLGDLLASRTRLPIFDNKDDWSRMPAFGGTIIERRKGFAGFILKKKPNMANFLTEKISFSVAGYVLAASMLEKVSGKSWEQLLTDYIRKPFRVTIGLSWPNQNDADGNAGHWSNGAGFHAEEPDTWMKINPILYPAQSINISLPDYIRFVQENMRGLAGSSNMLSPTTYNYMFFGMLDYAEGWNNGSLNDLSYAFHEGTSVLFSCRVSILKEKNLAVIVMCNDGDRDGRAAVINLSRMLESYYIQ